MFFHALLTYDLLLLFSFLLLLSFVPFSVYIALPVPPLSLLPPAPALLMSLCLWRFLILFYLGGGQRGHWYSNLSINRHIYMRSCTESDTLSGFAETGMLSGWVTVQCFFPLPLSWNSLQKPEPWQQPLQPWLWDLSRMTSLEEPQTQKTMKQKPARMHTGTLDPIKSHLCKLFICYRMTVWQGSDVFTVGIAG